MEGALADEDEPSHFKDKVLLKATPVHLSKCGPIQTQAERLRLRAESGCVSLRSDCSRNAPPLFSPEPDPEPQSVSGCASLRSDCSRNAPLLFSPELDPQPQETPVSCALCGSVPKDPVSSSCGHRFCKRCFSLNCDQFVSTQLCPQCGHILHINNQGQSEFKHCLKQKCERVCEGTETEAKASLNSSFTEVYITEGYGEEASAQHEEMQLQTKRGTEEKSEIIVYETPIRCNDIFKQLEPDQKPIRVVLSSGVAGVGKTFSVLKFCLDWALELENKDLKLVVPLSFRELNLVKRGRYSLLELIQLFHPALQSLMAHTLNNSKVLFIFDGLDESRLHLNFNHQVISEVTQRSEVGTLLVNLIKGQLLPDALIWITSRPAAAIRIPARCVDRFTEVRGFLTHQKAEYFTKRFTNEQQLKTVLSHIRTSRSLDVMCSIPVFCWITSTVLDHVLRSEASGGPLPQTLTDMFAHFILVQTQRKRKYRPENGAAELTQADSELLLKLGRLAFEQLLAGNIMFYQEDLQKVGLDPTDASLHSGLCTEIFKQENIVFNKSVYCFVHLSVQEFLAAVYMLNCFNNRKEQHLKRFQRGWNPPSSIDVFLKAAMDQSLQTTSGHLDLLVRFLHGLTLESNQKLLGALLGPMRIDSETRHKVISNLKKLKTKTSPDRSINIFHCLTEINDHSVHLQIQEFLKSGNKAMKLSDIQCSALAYMLQMLEEVVEELNLKNYNTSRAGSLRLVPAVRNCTKAVLMSCGLSKTHLEVVASALKSSPSRLKILNLSENQAVGSEIEVLCDGLQSPHCRLETLILNDCSLSASSCASLASALMSSPSHLMDLELGDNPDLRDSGVERLCAFLQSSDCRLKILRLWACNLSESSCSSLASALKSNPSHLIDLKLGNNSDLGDSGVRHLCELLHNPDCRLETLELNNCGLSEFSCSCLVSALKSNPCSHLKALELGENKSLRDSGVEHLCTFLQSPECRLETLSLWSCSLTRSSCLSLVSALKSNPSHLRELDLRENTKLEDSGVEHLCVLLQSTDCRLEKLKLSSCSLSESSCSSLASALESGRSRLKELDVRGNDLKHSEVQELRRRLDILRW